MAQIVLVDWPACALATGVRILDQFTETLEDHQEGVLNYYDYRISTGPLEGTNTKIQLVKRQAEGFQDHEFLKSKPWASTKQHTHWSDEPKFNWANSLPGHVPQLSKIDFRNHCGIISTIGMCMEMMRSIHTTGDVADFAGKVVAYNAGTSHHYFDVPDKYLIGDGSLCYGVLSRTPTPYAQSGNPLGGPTGTEEGYEIKAVIRPGGSIKTRAFVNSRIAEASGLQMREATAEEITQIREAVLDGKANLAYYSSPTGDSVCRQALGLPDRCHRR